jgi:probable F420-dependent oxidoreductase
MAGIRICHWCCGLRGHSVDHVKFGLFGINLGPCVADVAGIAELAEASGWESVWTGEHYVLPEPPTTGIPSDLEFLDPFVALALAAARTERLLLGTGVTVVPMHQPLALAKRVASIDRVSGGRFLFGVGVGYLESEFRALGMPFDSRGDRTIEYLDAMTAIWNNDVPTFRGRFFSFDGVRAEPRPIQLPTPPLHFGGFVPATYRRAVERGTGWYGFDLDFEATAKCVAQLRAAGGTALEISITPSRRMTVDPEAVARFAELGVTRLILHPPRKPAELRRFVADFPTRSAV